MPFAARSFDAVSVASGIRNVPRIAQALAEAFRVLREGASLAVFDGDYGTTTVALGDHDPLQACADAAVAALVHDRWLVRRLPALVAATGFQVVSMRSHGYVEAGEASYMLTIVDRGADLLGPVAEALRAEARRRVSDGSWFGHIAYASLIARR